MSRYRWARLAGRYKCPDGHWRAAYVRMYAHKHTRALRADGRHVYACTIRNRRVTGALDTAAGTFTPDRTPAARRAFLESAAGRLRDAAQAAEGVLARMADRGELNAGSAAVLEYLQSALRAADGAH